MENISGELCISLKNKLDLFNFLGPGDLEKLSGFLMCKNAAAGETLWKEGDSCDYLAFIISGRVELKKQMDLKGNHVLLGIHSTGTFIGELCILDGSPRAVTAAALDNVALVVITRDNFNKLNNENPELGGKLMKGILLSVSKRLRNSFNRLVSVL